MSESDVRGELMVAKADHAADQEVAKVMGGCEGLPQVVAGLRSLLQQLKSKLQKASVACEMSG